MTAAQKEQIYVQLREYHLQEFPESLVNPQMDQLLAEYRAIEDQVISMLLGFVNGRSEFVDMGHLVTDFKAKSLPKKDGDKLEKDDRELFVSKSNMLSHIISTAEQASFVVRPPRKSWESTRKVVTKITRK